MTAAAPDLSTQSSMRALSTKEGTSVMDPAKVEHLTKLLHEVGLQHWPGDEPATWLLANGVDVTLPPAPSWPVGTTGTVGLADHAWYPAIREEGGFVYVDETGDIGEVADGEWVEFTAAVLLTPERVEELDGFLEGDKIDDPEGRKEESYNEAIDSAREIVRAKFAEWQRVVDPNSVRATYPTVERSSTGEEGR